MKPNFALNLTDTGISLLHRTSRGWMAVGETAFDNPDLDEALGYLRSSALGLSPHGITTKLVLPPSQVLYLELEVDADDRAAQRPLIVAALDGRTPYDVADLVFDWRGKGAAVKVAVVAKETLAEAEAFAVQHRFNPVSFVTVPGEDQFGAEPFFGATSASSELLPEGETVTRDKDPIVILTRELPKPDPVTEAEAERAIAERQAKAEARRSEVEAEAARLKSETAREAEVARLKAIEDAKVAAEKAKADELAKEQAQKVEAAASELAKNEAARLEAERAKAALIAAEKARFQSSKPEAPTTDAGKGPSVSFASRRRDEADDAGKTTTATGLASSAPTNESASRDAKPGALGKTEVGTAVFASAAVSAPAGASRVDVANAPALRSQPEAGDAPTIKTNVPPPASAKVAPIIQPSSGLSSSSAIARSLGSPASQPKPSHSPAGPFTATVLTPSNAGKLGKSKGKVERLPPTQPAPGAATMGSFGAKIEQRQRGKPRFLGLILTLLLLAALAAIAALSSYYVSRDNNSAQPTAIASDALATEPPLATEPAEPVEIPDAIALDAPQPTAIPDALIEPEAANDAEADVAADSADLTPIEPAAEPEEVAVAPNLPQSDTAGAPAVVPNRNDQQETLLAAMDGPPPAFDAVALPAPQSAPDTAPLAAMPPPPLGTTYEFEADGTIKPTAQGVITPDGVRLIAARPVPEPPTRPQITLVPELIETPPDSGVPALTEDNSVASTPGLSVAATQTSPLTETTVFAPDTSVIARRPQGRPESLDAVPAPQAEDDGAALAADAAITRLTSLRPRLRPETIFARAEAIRAADEVRVAAAAASLVAATPAVQATNSLNASPLAVAISRRPAARPRDFSKAVSAAIAEATRAPEPGVQRAPAAEPEEEAEPEVRASAAPRIPTRASVAKQATFTNAINLSKINLIGVYGTANKRYALIRSSSGRYTKVRVGDRVDGGTVAAITSNEVRYQKGGRMLALSMPKG
jgi:hypothetical protein